MSFVLLDDGFYTNPKVTAVGNAGAGLFARALSYCGHNLTDGFVEAGWAREVGGLALCKKLAAAGLWITVQSGEDFTYIVDESEYVVRIPRKGYFIVDYLTLNPTRQHIEAKRDEVRQKRSEAGKMGAKARWGDGKPDSKHDGKADGKPIANGMATAMAKAPDANGKTMANAWQTDSPTPIPLGSSIDKPKAVSVADSLGIDPDEINRRLAEAAAKDMEAA